MYSTPRDPSFANVSSLLHFEGVDGSTTFTDQIGGKTWGVSSGFPQISTDQSRFGGSSFRIALVGSNILETTDAGTAFYLNGDYSVEGWIYVTNTAQAYIWSMDTTGGSGGGVSLFLTSTGTIRHDRAGDSPLSVSDGGGSVIGRWIHAYAGRQGTTNYVACNGVMNTSISNTSAIGTTFASAKIGYNLISSGFAYFDDIRITKGVCRYTTSFTPPTAPFPDM